MPSATLAGYPAPVDVFDRSPSLTAGPKQGAPPPATEAPRATVFSVLPLFVRPARFGALVSDQVGTFRRYLDLMRWLVGDFVWRYRWRTAVVLASGSLGVSCQATAIGQAIFYCQGLANDETIHLLGRDIALRSSVPALFAFGIASATLILVAAGLEYLSKIQAVHQSILYQTHSISRLVAALGRGAGPVLTPEDEIGSEAELQRVAKTNARYCGIAGRSLLNAITPVITLVGALALLFWLNPWLTFAIAGLMAGASPLMVKASRAGARHTAALRDTGSESASEIRRHVRWLQSSPAPGPPDEGLEHALLTNRSIQDWNEAYEGRLRVVALAELISNGVLAVALLLMFLLLGGDVFLHGEGWGRLAAYVVGLRYAMVNMRQGAQNFTTINRYFYALQAYRRALDTLRAAPEPEPEPERSSGDDDALTVTTGPQPLPMSRTSLRLDRGQRLGVLSPLQVNRFDLARLLGALFPSDADGLRRLVAETSFVSDRVGRPPPGSLESVDALDSAAEIELVRAPTLLDAWRRLRSEWAVAAEDDEAWGRLDAAPKAVLALVLALGRGGRVFVVAESALAAFDDAERAELLTLLDDRIVVIVGNETGTSIGRHGEDAVAITDAQAVLGLFEASEFESRREEIEEEARQILARVRAETGGGADIEEDDEMG